MTVSGGKSKLVCLVACLIIGVYVTRMEATGSSSNQCKHKRNRNPVGRECSRRCVSDVDCRSERKECLCDGECGRSCINKHQRCSPHPSDIDHGSVSIKPYNKFNAVAKYTCEDGYTLVGRSVRVCQGDATWQGQSPRCEVSHGIVLDNKVDCGPAPPAPHAHSNAPKGQMNFKYGTKLDYSCDRGYTQHKNSVEQAWCVTGGIWVGPSMTCTTSRCQSPPDILHGYIQGGGHNTPGSRVHYRCREGYFLIGKEERTCQKDGSWTGKDPACEQVVCGPPLPVLNAEHNLPTDTIRFPTGTELIYSCLFGYYRNGTNRAICSGRDGSWIGPEMTCMAKECGSPGEVINGRRAGGYRFLYPTRVSYSCHNGYEMRGRGYRDCQANGEWSNSVPECKPIHCPELGPPLHGTMIGSGTAFGSVIRYVCNDSFKVVGSPERTCQADQIWSGHDAFCEEINCGMPGPLWNGYLDGHQTTVGSIYFFRCNIRAKLKGTSISTTCMQNGQWSNPVPLCLGQCSIPSIMNGTITDGREGIFVVDGTSIKPMCLNGLVLNDSRPVTCNNGTWSLIPKCVPAPCNSSPPQIDHGHRVFFSLSHGARARYFCIAGYKLVEKSKYRYMTCEFGKWSGTRPMCEENHCPNPGNLTNGQIKKVGKIGHFPFSHYITIIKHGERLAYECNRDFRLVGPRGAACVNGAWSPNKKPRCERSRHPLFNRLWRPMEEESRPKSRSFYRK